MKKLLPATRPSPKLPRVLHAMSWWGCALLAAGGSAPTAAAPTAATPTTATPADGGGAAASVTDQEPRPLLVQFDRRSLNLQPAAVQAALAAHVTELGYVVRVRADDSRPPADPVVVRVALRRTAPDSVHLEVWVPGERRPWSRSLHDDGDPDLLLETLGVVIRGIVTAPPRPIPDATLQAESPATSPAPAPRSRGRAPWIDLALAYRGETFAAASPWHSGVLASLWWQSRRGLVFGGSVAWVPRHRVDAGLAIQRVPVGLTAGWRWRQGRRVRPGLHADLVAEALGWRGTVGTASARPGWALRIGAGVAVDATIEVGAGVFAWGRVAGHVWPLSADLVLERSSTAPQSLIRSWPGSGQALVGLGVHFGRNLFFNHNRPDGATDGASE